MSYTTEKLEYLKGTKAAIKEAIISKGQPVSDGDTFRSYADKIAAIKSSSDDVRYVTFMSYDGSTEEGKIPVATGYDCPNPKFTSTRESDAQYDYTLVGWATTPNGGLDSNALKAVNEDRTVYACFAAVLKKYTITFRDGDTVLESKDWTYGETPTIANPTKSGFSFDGWEPAITAVTGDATYTAKWVEAITFANGAWEDIVRIAEAGEAQKYFALGDEREFEYTISALPETSNTAFESITYTTKLRVVGFDYDDLADGSGKAAVSIMSTTGFRSKPALSLDGSKYYWSTSLVRSKLNEALSGFPEALKSGIKSVKKVTTKWTEGNVAGEEITNDKLWVPSLGEFQLNVNMANKGAKSENIPAKYPGATVYNICTDGDLGFRTGSYTTRTNYIYFQRGVGNYSSAMMNSSGHFPFGFCI
jgi:hypothetical protein